MSRSEEKRSLRELPPELVLLCMVRLDRAEDLRAAREACRLLRDAVDKSPRLKVLHIKFLPKGEWGMMQERCSALSRMTSLAKRMAAWSLTRVVVDASESSLHGAPWQLDAVVMGFIQAGGCPSVHTLDVRGAIVHSSTAVLLRQALPNVRSVRITIYDASVDNEDDDLNDELYMLRDNQALGAQFVATSLPPNVDLHISTKGIGAYVLDFWSDDAMRRITRFSSTKDSTNWTEEADNDEIYRMVNLQTLETNLMFAFQDTPSMDGRLSSLRTLASNMTTDALIRMAPFPDGMVLRAFQPDDEREKGPHLGTKPRIHWVLDDDDDPDDRVRAADILASFTVRLAEQSRADVELHISCLRRLTHSMGNARAVSAANALRNGRIAVIVNHDRLPRDLRRSLKAAGFRVRRSRS